MAQARSIYGSVSDSIMHGMQLSVICSEDTELATAPADAGTLMGAEFIDFTLAQCEAWPKGQRAADFRAPLSGEVAVLAISGELDPVTPPRYGDEVVKGLANARHLVLPGQGHNVIGVGCMPKLFAQFIESGSAKALNAECLQRLSATPPFAGNYGWEP
jgi:pimeloyl-ACP methyl ester carboxylesterase